MAAQDSLKVFAIGQRTDSAGAAVNDVDQEELRMMLGVLLKPGYTANLLTQATNVNAFRVRQDTGSNLQVKVGSGTTKRDGYVLLGSVAGQGAYLVRLDAATKTVTVPAADTVNPRKYGVYLWIDDAGYSGTASRRYAGITCLAGTPAASPSVPAASAVWSANTLLWSFQLAANATAVTDTILDNVNAADGRRIAVPVVGGGALVAEASVTTSHTGITSTATDRTGLTVTFTNPGSRRYKASAHLVLNNASAGGVVSVTIQTGASGAGTAIGGSATNVALSTDTATVDPFALHTPAAGSVSYHVRVNSTTGTVDSYASSTTPAVLIVEDVGAG